MVVCGLMCPWSILPTCDMLVTCWFGLRRNGNRKLPQRSSLRPQSLGGEGVLAGIATPQRRQQRSFFQFYYQLTGTIRQVNWVER